MTHRHFVKRPIVCPYATTAWLSLCAGIDGIVFSVLFSLYFPSRLPDVLENIFHAPNLNFDLVVGVCTCTRHAVKAL